MPLTPLADVSHHQATQRPRERAIHLRKGWRHMRLSRAVGDFMQDARVSLARQTCQAYESDLNLLVALATFHAKDSVFDFTPDLVRRYFHELSAKGLSMATLHRRRASINQFGKWGVRRQLWAMNPVDHAPPIRKPTRLPRPFSNEDRAKLRALPLSGVERVLFDLLRYAGLRVGELCGLCMKDVSLSDGQRLGRLTVMGKGRKERVVPVIPELSETLKDWILATGDLMSPGAPLIRQRSGRPWTRRMVEKRTGTWGLRAGVEHCIPHRFRHEFASEMLARGVDIRVIQRLLGHADISTTALYADVADQALIDGVMKLSGRSSLP